MPLVTDLQHSSTLRLVGGKALNLTRLLAAGVRVPDGFIVTTEAYHAHLAAHRLGPRIRAVLADGDLSSPADLARVAEQIRALFDQPLPADLEAAVTGGLAGLAARAGTPIDGLPVAVRSSATAEDLPGLSFAGQQDTFLNELGGPDVLAAVRQCWASLWTARAIGYREAHGISHDDVALAVVVQTLVPADVSGVLFTANPVTGVRRQIVVDATVGLGEALVSGQVEPDHVVLAWQSGAVLESTVGAKAVATRPLPGGGVQTSARPDADRREPALTDGQLRQLAAVARAIDHEYGTAQDVEWAFAGDDLWVLQSRAITTLFDVPVALAALHTRSPDDSPAGGADPASIWFSFGAFQGVLDPITPLGRDAIARLAAGAGQMFGLQLRPDRLAFLGVAHERLWVRLDGLLRHPLGRRIAPKILAFAEPGSADLLADLIDDQPSTGWNPSGLRRFGLLLREIRPRLILTLRHPEEGRRFFDHTAAAVVAEAAGAQVVAERESDPDQRLAARVRVAADGLRGGLRTMFPAFAPIMAPSMVLLAGLNRLVADRPQAADRALPLTLLRGLPGNVTTEMDLALWQVALAIRAAGEGAAIEADPQAAAQRYQRGELGATTQRELAEFLRRYGMRGVAEIDLGRPRWRERPDAVLSTLASYLAIDPSAGPDRIYARGVAEAAAAAERLASLAGRRRPLVRFAVRRIRTLLGARETPKFTLISIFGLIRAGLLESGADLVAAGFLDRPDDVCFLTLAELGSENRSPWRTLVRRRRALHEAERHRRAVPRFIRGDGFAHYGTVAGSRGGGVTVGGRRVGGPGVDGPGVDGRGSGGTEHGSGVSPGVTEGIVRVVHDPHDARLRPGEILVCRGTDPAWTPLFLVAAGLITEVGGMMTHGSVVAREYGIPAVVGVADATTRLTTGRRIRLDGGSGLITLLDAADSPQ